MEEAISNGAQIDLDKLSDGTAVTTYETELKYGEILDCSKLWNIDKAIPESGLSVLAISDYNKLLSLQGIGPIELERDELFINCNYDGTIKQIEEFVEENGKITLNGEELRVKSNEPIYSRTYMLTAPGNNDHGTFIAPDEVAKKLKPSNQLYVGNIVDDQEKYSIESKLDQRVNRISVRQGEAGVWFLFAYQTKRRMTELINGFQGILIFVMMYLGVVMAIVSVSILSIQVMSEIVEQTRDYKILKSLGTSPKSINKLILNQIILYFVALMLLAVPFSYVGRRIVVSVFEKYFKMKVLLNWNETILVAVVAVVYLLVTYWLSRKNIREEI